MNPRTLTCINGASYNFCGNFLNDKKIKIFAAAVSLLCLLPVLTACGTTQKNLTVVVYNYWPRAIADVSINGKYAGGSFGAYGPGGTGGSMVAGVPIHVGEQKIEWVLDGNLPRLNETLTATAILKDIPSDSKVLAIHIYPDETVFVETARRLPGERLQDVKK
ncbi:hypothetical protein [Undibacterium sp. Ren11W]|uniref:hypothetical protein n=1 Tax=Undibacterium sp. Ren11W TaxID=3413045 RepID=UPI003BF3D49A